jgi:Putative S-adenosyl-L-methionine-dependent methyltransferase
MSILPPSNEPRENTGRPASETQVSSALNQGPVVLESDVPISRSLIWGLQRDFYAQRGLKSWTDDMVPQFITNNPFIAEIYARVVFGFICDCIDPEEENSRRLSVQNPLRILELGAGVGKFAFLFLRHLEALLQTLDFPLNTVRYCMTDCSDSLVQTWRTHKCLSDFFERGILRFELLDASGEITPRFLEVDPSQSSEQAYGPLVVIANYVFDSLPNDAFAIEGGQVFEQLLTTTAACQDSDKTLPADVSQLKFSYRNVEITADHYPDPAWNSILDLYRRRLPAATVLFPSQVLTILHAISKFTNGTMLVLASDKGYACEDSLLASQGTPTLEFHAVNCFSQMVNFDAIAKYFEATGGVALLPNKHSSSLDFCAFLQGPPGHQFLATKTRYQEARSNIGPDDLFALLGWLNPHMEEMSVPQILALLRFSRWDPTTLVRLFPVLARQIRTVSAERHDLRNAVMLTWANHFPITPGENILAFYCGVILLELRFYEEAFSMLKRSQDLLGRSAATSYNLGLCSLGLGRSSEALALMFDACQLDPAFEPAQLLRRKLEDEQVTQ